MTANVEMDFGIDGRPFSFKINGQEIGDIVTAVNVNLVGGEEPFILLRFSPETVQMNAEVDELEHETGAFLDV